MKTLKLKDTEISIPEDMEGYLGSILEIADVPGFEEMTRDEFNTALATERLFRGETLSLPNGGKIRLKTETRGK